MSLCCWRVAYKLASIRSEAASKLKDLGSVTLESVDCVLQYSVSTSPAISV